MTNQTELMSKKPNNVIVKKSKLPNKYLNLKPKPQKENVTSHYCGDIQWKTKNILWTLNLICLPIIKNSKVNCKTAVF